MRRRIHPKHILTLSGKLALYACAAVGVVFIGVYVAIRMHWTNVAGTVDLRSSQFQAISEAHASTATAALSIPSTVPTDEQLSLDEIDSEIATLQGSIADLDAAKETKQRTLCRIEAASQFDGVHAANMMRVYKPTQSDALIDNMIFALEPYVNNEQQYTDAMHACEDTEKIADVTVTSTTTAVEANSDVGNIFPWINAEEWSVLAEAIEKDEPTIASVAEDSGVEKRLIVSSLIVEQLRLYHTQRALFKQFFQPLNILASATKTSWGVMSIKEETAIAIEEHLKDTSSEYYLGTEYEHLLDFSSSDHSGERYARLTNERDHRYAYLYGALYMKQLTTQWKNAGYDIANRPEIVATLFNIGFNGSHPKATPQVGGAAIEINGTNYTFGGLAYEFYYSGEMMDDFPLHP
jgi:uncharacterized small protein (DUF1192 family)